MAPATRAVQLWSLATRCAEPQVPSWGSAGAPLGPSPNRFTTLRTVSFFEILPSALHDDLDSCMTATAKLAR